MNDAFLLRISLIFRQHGWKRSCTRSWRTYPFRIECRCWCRCVFRLSSVGDNGHLLKVLILLSTLVLWAMTTEGKSSPLKNSNSIRRKSCLWWVSMNGICDDYEATCESIRGFPMFRCVWENTRVCDRISDKYSSTVFHRCLCMTCLVLTVVSL